ncbi:c-type cytochrome [Noviherbaspirillum pedocola]|uniref:Cytochrome c5 family protein n=1 Tax=Noviherbaspirillum pedocola TaxID=2801341 RepID=A0A934W816_9BURK|nr:c-type cytochrome [Noviherbaspirillum pedocola]MBK4737035.1 cytochrome c5 family protein [Noviherbaspirillum pedocola]
MTDAHHESQSVIRTPKQLIAAVLAGFLVPIITIVLLVQYVGNTTRVGAGSESQSDEAIAERIKPVSDIGFTFRDANAPKQLQAGADVYKGVCAACHASGAAGAPKVGDAAAWSARIGQGYDTLVSHAVNGIRAMPAKGGNPDLDDVEVARAMVYMANQSGAKFKEPEVKANSSAAASKNEAMAAPAATPQNAAPASAAAPTPAAPAPAPTSTSATAADAGQKLYASACVACHGAGVAGAPKFGDKTAWADRLKQGKDVLYEHAIKGFQGKNGIMPAKGGSSASDEEVKAAVDYIAAAAK